MTTTPDPSFSDQELESYADHLDALIVVYRDSPTLPKALAATMFDNLTALYFAAETDDDAEAERLFGQFDIVRETMRDLCQWQPADGASSHEPASIVASYDAFEAICLDVGLQIRQRDVPSGADIATYLESIDDLVQACRNTHEVSKALLDLILDAVTANYSSAAAHAEPARSMLYRTLDIAREKLRGFVVPGDARVGRALDDRMKHGS